MNAGYEFEIRQSTDDQFYAVVRHKNGQVILTTETYTTKNAVKKTLENFTAWLFGAAVESQRSTIEKLIEDHTIEVPGGESV